MDDTHSFLKAVRKGDLANVRGLLIENPNLVFSRDDYDGDTPLHEAAEKGYKDVAELLLGNKAQINLKNKEGWTPLHLAAYKGRIAVVELLLDNCFADVNAQTKHGWTPLHWAANAGHRDVVELLLDNGADVNAKNDHAWTPLDRAADRGNKDVVEVLRQHGGQASTNAKPEPTLLEIVGGGAGSLFEKTLLWVMNAIVLGVLFFLVRSCHPH